jgi:hypothetical protein
LAREKEMLRRRITVLVCLGWLGIAGCVPQPGPQNNALSSAPPVAPGMARIWMLRQTDIVAQNFSASDPAVFLENVDLGHIARGTVFYHDVPPGTYRVRVQPYGTPTHLVDTVQLSPGVTAFLQVQAVPNWEQGSTASGASFSVLTMVPQDAEAAIPTLTFTGRR